MISFGTDKQSHYRAGRTIKTVRKSDIEGVCDCGYLILKPQSDFESHNGGLTVKRSQVQIVDDEGNLVKRLRGVNRYGSCNACVNDWK